MNVTVSRCWVGKLRPVELLEARKLDDRSSLQKVYHPQQRRGARDHSQAVYLDASMQPTVRRLYLSTATPAPRPLASCRRQIAVVAL